MSFPTIKDHCSNSSACLPNGETKKSSLMIEKRHFQTHKVSRNLLFRQKEKKKKGIKPRQKKTEGSKEWYPTDTTQHVGERKHRCC